MAYNPFDFFRKNQKIFFAVLTIIVMFMFVLSFGQGDFFSWFPRWLGAQKSSGEVLAEVDGGKVRDSDLGRVNEKRGLANRYMSQLADLQWRAINQRVQDTQLGAGKVSEEARRAIENAQRPFLNLQRSVEIRQQYGLGGPGPEYPEQMREALLLSRNELGKVITRPDLKSDDREAAQAQDRLLQAQLDQIARAQAGGRRDDTVYFATMPNRNARDRLEYLLWLKKADKLGIRYTEEDVKELVKLEAPDVKDDERLKLAAETVAGRERRATEDALYEALADEFRVRAAQTAVLGTTQVRLNGGLHTPAPQELFEFYKQQTAPTRYTFLTVPVGPFAAQVRDEPTEAELKKIFADYRYAEPDPSNPKAGVKEPRKVKVAWAEVTGTEAYYGPLAEERLKKTTDSRVSLLFTLPLGGGVLGNAVAPIAFKDLKYDAYKQTQGAIARLWADTRSNPGRPRLTEPAGAVLGGWPLGDPANTTRPFGPATRDPEAKLADASLARPHNVGVLAGLLGGAFATGGSLLTAPAVMTETGHAAEKEQRLLAGIQAFHFPTLPGLPVLGELTGADMAVLAALPQPLPQPLVQPLLDARSKDDLRAKAAADDARDFQKQLAEVMKKDDQTAAAKEAAELTAKFIKDRGLKTDATADLRDVHTIADAPAVAPLIPKSGMADPILKTLANPVRKSNFGNTLFLRFKANRNPLDRQGQIEPATGLYAPAAYPPQPDPDLPAPTEAAPLTLVWRTEETKAEAPREYNDPQVIERCKQVWRRLKARELARKACEDVAAQAQEAGDSPARLNQRLLDAEKALQERLKPGTGVRLISDFKYDIAPLVKESERSPTMMGGGNGLRAFGPGLLQGDDFVYPTPKMTEDLLANRDKPVGTAVVLADHPETTLYVAVVTGKDQADPATFRSLFLKRSPLAGLTADPRETVVARHAADARKQARDEAVALLKAEFGYANEHPELDKRSNEAAE